MRYYFYIIIIPILAFLLSISGCEDVEEPTLYSVIPNQGYDSGGTSVTLSGDFFDKNATVYFDDTEASYLEYNGSDEIIAVTPPHSPGLVDVRVKNSGSESSTLDNAFTYYDIDNTILFFEGKTTISIGNNPGHIVIFDINQDGYEDIAVTQYFENYISLLLNQGDGTFMSPLRINATENLVNMINKDLNNDGNDDLAITSDYIGLLIFLNNGDGTFADYQSYPAGDAPSGLFGADLDNDNDIDLVVANADWGASNGADSHISVYMNAGDGIFTEKVDYQTGTFSSGVIAADLDNDGDSDLVIIRDKYFITLMNTGDGTFSDMVNYEQGFSNSAIKSSDIDNDSDQDIVILDASSNEAYIFFNDGFGTFTYINSYSVAAGVAGLSLLDLDNDGNIDMATGSFYEGVVSVRRNLGNGTYGELIKYQAGTKANGPVSADLDNDGDLDIVCANGRPINTLTILYNQIK